MALPLPRPCTVCQRLTQPGQSRCRECRKQAEAVKRFRRKASGDDAQQRLRRELNRIGFGTCSMCRVETLSEFLNVDHRVPLADGGRDIDSNVWLLCVACHKDKTAKEATDRSRR